MLAKDEAAARKTLAGALAMVREGWEAESTANNLKPHQPSARTPRRAGVVGWSGGERAVEEGGGARRQMRRDGLFQNRLLRYSELTDRDADGTGRAHRLGARHPAVLSACRSSPSITCRTLRLGSGSGGRTRRSCRERSLPFPRRLKAESRPAPPLLRNRGSSEKDTVPQPHIRAETGVAEKVRRTAALPVTLSLAAPATQRIAQSHSFQSRLASGRPTGSSLGANTCSTSWST